MFLFLIMFERFQKATTSLFLFMIIISEFFFLSSVFFSNINIYIIFLHHVLIKIYSNVLEIILVVANKILEQCIVNIFSMLQMDKVYPWQHTVLIILKLIQILFERFVCIKQINIDFHLYLIFLQT